MAYPDGCSALLGRRIYGLKVLVREGYLAGVLPYMMVATMDPFYKSVILGLAKSWAGEVTICWASSNSEANYDILATAVSALCLTAGVPSIRDLRLNELTLG